MTSSLVTGFSQMSMKSATGNKTWKPFVEESPEECSRRLYVRNIPRCFDEVDIYRLFEPYGIITDIRFPNPLNETQCSRFAFVTFMKKAMSVKARLALDQKVTVKHDTVDLVLASPLRVDEYILRHNLPQKRSPFKEMQNNASSSSMPPPRPLLDFESESMLYDDQTASNPRKVDGRVHSRPPRRFTPNKHLANSNVEGITHVQLSDEKYQDIVLTSYNNPDDFYVRLLSCDGAYQNLLFRMEREYENKVALHDEILIGNLVAVKYKRDAPYDDDEESKWRRGYVTALCKNEDSKGVTYYCTLVDTGEKMKLTDRNNLHLLAKHFVNLPFQAIRCALGQIRPRKPDWPAEAVSNCLEFLSNREQVVSAKALTLEFFTEAQLKVGGENSINRALVNPRTLAVFRINDPFGVDDFLHTALVDQDVAELYPRAIPAETDPNYRLFRTCPVGKWLPSVNMLAIKEVVCKNQLKPPQDILDRIELSQLVPIN